MFSITKTGDFLIIKPESKGFFENVKYNRIMLLH